MWIGIQRNNSNAEKLSWLDGSRPGPEEEPFKKYKYTKNQQK